MQFRLYGLKKIAKIIFFPLDIWKIFDAARRSSDNPFGRHHRKLPPPNIPRKLNRNTHPVIIYS